MRILILSHNEICYNPRLLKAADYFAEKGWEVIVFNPVTGIASREVYQNAIKNKPWTILENDISRRNTVSSVRWLWVSLINKFIALLWSKTGSKAGFTYFMNKGLIGALSKIKGRYDYILIHLVDNLPFAAGLKQRTGARLIYDSQEYFRGQYRKYAKPLSDWVNLAEPKFISSVDVLLATTNAMLEQLKKDYRLSIPSFRVRNLPSRLMLQLPEFTDDDPSSTAPLKLVWHGMTIYFNNTRGLTILLKAVANCKTPVHLYLQGLITTEEKAVFENFMKDEPLKGKVSLLAPAEPYEIVNSLVHYDIGLIGELAQEENQMLTSSNKLFDFINAGLTVIASDLPGLKETINEYQCGYSYPSGDFLKMAELIDRLGEDRSLLKQMKLKSRAGSQKGLNWELDYDKVWSVLQA